MRHYYAKQAPRGFANEVIVHKFVSKQARDQWIMAHKDDGDVNSAACGARTCTAREAQSILGYTGDAVTESYNAQVDHC